MPRHPLLSDAQRSALLNAHFQLDEREMARYWTLSEQDLDHIQGRRRDWNRFGFALQLCLLRFPGWPPKRQDRIPLPLLLYVGQQLDIPADEIEDYFRRQPTRSDHLQELMDLYGFRPYTIEEGRSLRIWLLPLARRWESSLRLVTALIEEMRRRGLVLPALSTIELIVWQVGQGAEQETFAQLTETLSPLQRVELDDLLIPSVEVEKRSLTWLRRAIGAPGGQRDPGSDRPFGGGPLIRTERPFGRGSISPAPAPTGRAGRTPYPPAPEGICRPEAPRHPGVLPPSQRRAVHRRVGRNVYACGGPLVQVRRERRWSTAGESPARELVRSDR